MAVDASTLAELVFDGAEMQVEQYATDHGLRIRVLQDGDRTLVIRLDDGTEYKVKLSRVRGTGP